MSNIEDYFTNNYSDARARFLAACRSKDLKVQTFVNEFGDDSEVELATDLTIIGDVDARKLLIVTSGVHGAELMCGSGCQVGMIEESRFSSRPDDTAVILLHALNPWGAANLRRNNEDNIDLCRNFLEFTQALPRNEHYEAIHELLLCPDSEGKERDDVNNRLAQFKAEKGMSVFIGAIMSGQFEHADGISFGGQQACWSNRTLMSILGQYANKAAKVCLLDYHSGLGPYAYGSLVCMQSGRDLQRARDWFGHWLTAPMEDVSATGDKFQPYSGHTTEGHIRALPQAELTSVVLEYGTYDMGDNLQALLDDHWLTLHGDLNSPVGQKIKQAMLATHYPNDPEWRASIWTRSEQVIRQALKGLQHD